MKIVIIKILSFYPVTIEKDQSIYCQSLSFKKKKNLFGYFRSVISHSFLVLHPTRYVRDESLQGVNPFYHFLT